MEAVGAHALRLSIWLRRSVPGQCQESWPQASPADPEEGLCLARPRTTKRVVMGPIVLAERLEPPRRLTCEAEGGNDGLAVHVPCR